MGDMGAWVTEVISKLDDDEAQLFGLMLASDLHHADVLANERILRRLAQRDDEEITKSVAAALLDHLNEGGDPGEALAVAAAVSIAKAGDNWWDFQERDKNGRFGRMTGAQYRAQVNVERARMRGEQGEAKAKTEAAIADIKAQRKGYTRGGGLYGDVRGTGQTARDTTKRFGEGWNRSTSDESQATDAFRRLEAGGKLVQQLGAATGSPKVAIAGAVGNYAGQFGPEAEKVIGPSVRRAAYRYRGTERTPDSALSQMVKVQEATVLHQEGRPMGANKTTVKGKIVMVPHKEAGESLSGPERQYAAEKASILYFLGGYKDPRTGEKVGSRLPSARLSELHRKSGKITPSEGVMIDRDGKVVHQAVGFGEDHYLPFNMKNLSALKGGSYVRTRESGGLTTEDIYAGLVTGARSMTVVSNSGIFTVDFADDLRGGRRYSDKAHQMVDRYGKTLDAVKSKQVANPKAKLNARDRARIVMNAEAKIESDPNLKYFPDEQKKAWVAEAVRREEEKPVITPEMEEEIDRNARAGAKDEREYAYIKRALTDEALDQANVRNYQLDGEGYGVAMEALKEQFPYFIDKIRVQTKRGNDQFNRGTDQGYVKPRYNRPEAAQEGYYDTSITGRGKTGADRTGYQNWRVRGSRGEQVASVGEDAPGALPAKPQNQTPDEASKEKATAAAKDNEGKARQGKLDEALGYDIGEWNAIHRSDENGMNPVKYSRIRAWHEKSPDERKVMLADPTERQALVREKSAAAAEYGEFMRKHGREVPNAYETTVKGANRAKMSAEMLNADKAPEVPVAIEAESKEQALKRQEMTSLLGLSDDKLVDLSNRFRGERASYEKAGNAPEAKRFHEQVGLIEYARSIKHDDPPDLFDELDQVATKLKPVAAVPQQGGRLENQLKMLRIAWENGRIDREQLEQDARDLLDDNEEDPARRRELWRATTG